MIDKRILDLENPAQEVIASDQKRLVVDAFARYKITNPLQFYQSVGIGRRRQFAAVDLAQLGAAPGARRGDPDPGGARRARRADGAGARPARHARRRPSASTSSTSAFAAPTCRSRTARRSISACRPNASARRPRFRAQGSQRAQEIRAEADRDVTVLVADATVDQSEQIARRGRRRAEPDLRRGLRPRPGLLRVLPLDAGLRGRPERNRHAHAAEAGLGLLPLLRRPVRQAAERSRRRRRGADSAARGSDPASRSPHSAGRGSTPPAAIRRPDSAAAGAPPAPAARRSVVARRGRGAGDLR